MINTKYITSLHSNTRHELLPTYLLVRADDPRGASRRVRGLHLCGREHPREAGEGGDADRGSQAWDSVYQAN